MKSLRTAISFAMILTTLAAVAEPTTQKSFDLLKTFSGAWEGKTSDGQPLEVSYRMTGGGSGRRVLNNLKTFAEQLSK